MSVEEYAMQAQAFAQQASYGALGAVIQGKSVVDTLTDNVSSLKEAVMVLERLADDLCGPVNAISTGDAKALLDTNSVFERIRRNSADVNSAAVRINQAVDRIRASM